MNFWLNNMINDFVIYGKSQQIDHRNNFIQKPLKGRIIYREDMWLQYILITSNNESQVQLSTKVININQDSPCMKIIIIALLCMGTLQQNILLSSSPSNTIITSPAGQTVAAETYHNTNNLNYISYSAQWLSKSGSLSWPYGDLAVFQAQFTANCKSLATLIITADNIFVATLNGGAAMTGNNWQQVYKFDLTNIQCGTNTLTITAINQHNSSPATVIFAVVQDQTDCYACSSLNSFYNNENCQCQCSNAFTSELECISPLYTWYSYPTCGCKCRPPQECAYARSLQGYDCILGRVLFGYIQDEITCQIRRVCQNTYYCPKGKIWDTISCSCSIVRGIPLVKPVKYTR